MWLSGLVDLLEDRIIACENLLTINPANENVRAYLADLRRDQQALLAKNQSAVADKLLQQAEESAKHNNMASALLFAREAVEEPDTYADAWLFIGNISPDVDQQIDALEKANRLNPADPETFLMLQHAKHLRANPLNYAAPLEQLGKFEDALKLYKERESLGSPGRVFLSRVYPFVPAP